MLKTLLKLLKNVFRDRDDISIETTL